jgi:hypothetical protein
MLNKNYKPMSTTSVFIEHLIAGIQATIWFVLSILIFQGFDWIKPEYLKDTDKYFILMGFAVVYPLGVFIDEGADRIFRKKGNAIKKQVLQDIETTVGLVLERSKSDSLTQYFNYVKMRIRICRVSCINFILITITSMFCIAFHFRETPYNSKGGLMAIVFFTGILLTGLAYYGWMKTTETFYEKVKGAWHNIQGLAV